MLYNVRNEVRTYGQDTQTQLQELDFKVQTIIEWQEKVSQVFNIEPPFLPAGMRSDIPIPILLSQGDTSHNVHGSPSQKDQGDIVQNEDLPMVNPPSPHQHGVNIYERQEASLAWKVDALPLGST